MIRLVLGEDGGLVVDLAGRSFGRGAWVHPRTDCIDRAARGGVDKSFKGPVTEGDTSAVFDRVRDAANRRVEALIASAGRSGNAVSGSDVARAAVEEGRAQLLVVAEDARAAAQATFVTRVAAAGKVVTWGTKETLGRATGRPDTAIVAISDRGLSDAIVRSVALSSIPGPDARRGKGQAVVEVR
jgi:ribosomal protein L7Ae-like RNA K-turn-binding protein